MANQVVLTAIFDVSIVGVGSRYFPSVMLTLEKKRKICKQLTLTYTTRKSYAYCGMEEIR